MQAQLENESNTILQSAIGRWMTENAAHGVLVTDAELRISYCNRWIEKQVGRSESETKGEKLLSVFPEIAQRGLEHYYYQALKGESRVVSHGLHQYLLALPALAGSEVEWMQQSARIGPLVVGSEIIGTITIIEDVTERVTRERELRVQIEEKERLLASELAARELAEENGRVKDEFLATVSHEIRAPLNAIRGWSRILRGGAVDPQTFEHALDTIDRNVVAQSELIEDLLDVSRMVTGQLNLEFQAVDLVEILNSVADSMSPVAAGKDLEMRKTFATKSSFVIADRDRLQQVLWNLFSNAIKFTPEKGRVEISLLEDENFVNVSVRDTGIGISADFIPYVFDRFRQGDGGRRRRHGGLGLGLSIVKNLVALHGGTVAVESEGEGNGTCFTIKLPRLGLSDNGSLHQARKGEPAQPASPETLNHRILIVDDDLDARETLRIILGMRHAEIASAGSVEEALSLFDDFRPDLLISDLGMPGMDGYDLIKQIRALPPENGGGVPAIALSGYVSIDEQTRVKESGFDSYVPKPLDYDTLIKKIGELLPDVQT